MQKIADIMPLKYTAQMCVSDMFRFN